MQGPHSLGFIGTGVMGEPMCRNLAAHSGHRVLAWDPSPAPLEQLRGAQTVAAVPEEARAAGYGGAYYPVIAKIVDRG